MRVNLIPLTLASMVFAGCSEQPQTTEAVSAVTGSMAAAKGGPAALSAVSLIVTVSDGAAYGIQSDGKGAYTNGSQNVSAVLDTYGTFAFNTPSTANKAETRWLTYNFNSPVDPLNSYRPGSSNTAPHHISTGPSSFSPFIPIQTLGINGNPTSECVYMGNSVANSTTTWRVSFHKGAEDVAGSPAAYAVVMRTSVSPAVWTIAPSGACSPNSNVAALRSSDSSVLYGYYNLPFLFTLRAK